MMFHTDKPIFLQVADRLADEIMTGRYADDDRIPSVREYAVLFEVNTNTVMKAYEQLARANIIYNKRGMGYFVTPGAREQVLNERRKQFLEQTLPELFQRMSMLRLGIEDVVGTWQHLNR